MSETCMIKQITLSTNHPHYSSWLSDIRKLCRPIINHPAPSMLIIPTDIPKELEQSGCVVSNVKKDDWPSLTDTDFIQLSPIVGKELLIGGPCCVETEEQMHKTVSAFHKHGFPMIRGGLFKPRSSAHSFQGLGFKGIELIQKVKAKTPFEFVSEITCPTQVKQLSDVVDVFQVGTRNMENTELLKVLGKQDKPVILKRGRCATYQDWLNSAEYIIREGNPRVILCERGIRTFETSMRNTLDITAFGYLKRITNLPVICDPSHACGDSHLVPSLAMASKVAGADGLLVEAHPDPEHSVSDAKQALGLNQCIALFKHYQKTSIFVPA